VPIEEALVVLDLADVLAFLAEFLLVGGSARLFGRGADREDALEGLVGRLGEQEHLLARLLDVRDVVVAREIGQGVNRLLPGAAKAGEDLPRQLRAVRTDLVHLADQAGGLSGGVEDPIFRQQLVGALGLAFVVTAQQLALEVEDLDLALVDAHPLLSKLAGIRRTDCGFSRII